MSSADRAPGRVRPDHSSLGDADKRAALTEPCRADGDAAGRPRPRHRACCAGCTWPARRRPALGWLWKLPDWWTQADTLEVVALGLTVAEYAARAAARHHAAERAAIAAMEAAEPPSSTTHARPHGGPPGFHRACLRQ